MIKKIAIGLVALIAVLALIVSLQPSTFSVSRTSEIEAPPAAVFAILNDLRQGGKWSPSEQADPGMKKTYSGPASGVGSSLTWDGNADVGAGTLTIVESKPDELIRLKLDFVRPMSGTNEVRYEFFPTSTGTKLTWTIEGKKGFVSKAVCMFMDLDSAIGPVFEKGLKQLNELAVSQPGKK